MSFANDFYKIISDVFKPDPKWTEWYVKNVFNEDNLFVAKVDEKPAAVLLASPYEMEFHGATVPCRFISSVATLAAHRGKGLMRSLMHMALDKIWSEHTPFAAIIPASRPLYFIYDRMGFATVFYVNEERYSSVHQFEKGDFEAVEPTFEFFSRLEKCRKGNVRHNEAQFKIATESCRLSLGSVYAVSNGEGSEAMAFTKFNGHEIVVVDILATDPAAYEAVLSQVRLHEGDKSIILYGFPTDDTISLRSYAMIRLVNVKAVLDVIAKAYPKTSMTIRVKDSFLPQNNGIYILKSGNCMVEESFEKIDLDVSAKVLAEILFSTPQIGDLFNLPTRRPFISLMP